MTSEYLAFQLRAFMESPMRTSWLKSGQSEVYVRKSVRHIPRSGGLSLALDIANVTMVPARKGLYAQFLRDIEMMAFAHDRGVYVENVLDPEHFGIYLRRGYLQLDDCFYKAPPETCPRWDNSVPDKTS